MSNKVSNSYGRVNKTALNCKPSQSHQYSIFIPASHSRYLHPQTQTQTQQQQLPDELIQMFKQYVKRSLKKYVDKRVNAVVAAGGHHRGFLSEIPAH